MGLWYNATWPKTTQGRFLIGVEELIDSGLPEQCFSLSDKEIVSLKRTFHGWISALKTKLTNKKQVEAMLTKR